MQLLQGAGQRLTLANQASGITIGLKLSAATDGHLDQASCHWGQHGEGHDDDWVAVVVVSSTATKGSAPHGHIGGVADGSSDGGSYRAGQNVSAFHMGQLVGQHSTDFLPAQGLDQTFSNADGRIFWVASGGEGVWLALWGDVELGHGDVGQAGQFLHDVVVLGELIWWHLDSFGRTDGQLGASEVGPANGSESQDGPERHPAGTSKNLPEEDH